MSGWCAVSSRVFKAHYTRITHLPSSWRTSQENGSPSHFFGLDQFYDNPACLEWRMMEGKCNNMSMHDWDIHILLWSAKQTGNLSQYTFNVFRVRINLQRTVITSGNTYNTGLLKMTQSSPECEEPLVSNVYRGMLTSIVCEIRIVTQNSSQSF